MAIVDFPKPPNTVLLTAVVEGIDTAFLGAELSKNYVIIELRMMYWWWQW